METKPVNWVGRKASCTSDRALAQSTPFSGRGEIPHRRYAGMTRKPASGPAVSTIRKVGTGFRTNRGTTKGCQQIW